MLSKMERDILPLIEYQPGLTSDQLAKLIKAKSTTITTAIRRLKDKKAIVLKSYINPFTLGYTPVALYATLVTEALPNKNKITERLKKDNRVSHFSEMLGDYNHFSVFLVKNISEVPFVMKELYGGNGEIFSEKLISPRISSERFSRSFLTEKQNLRSKIAIMPSSPIYEIDELDHTLLSESSGKGFESIRDLAHQIGSPYATIERRIKKLTEANVICGFYYAIDKALIDSTHFRILLHNKSLDTSTNEKLLKFCYTHKNINFIIRSLGAWDYEIGIEVLDLKDVRKVIQDIYKLCGSEIGTVRVLTEIEDFKSVTYPFA